MPIAHWAPNAMMHQWGPLWPIYLQLSIELIWTEGASQIAKKELPNMPSGDTLFFMNVQALVLWYDPPRLNSKMSNKG